MVVLQVGRTVITNVQAIGGAQLTDAQPQVPMTLAVAAMLVGIAKQTVRNTISKYRDRFDRLEDPYLPGGERIITPRDLQTLRAMYPRRRSPKGGRQAKS